MAARESARRGNTTARRAAEQRRAVSLVVQHDVRQPDVLRGHVQGLDAAVLGRVPRQLVVVPLLSARRWQGVNCQLSTVKSGCTAMRRRDITMWKARIIRAGRTACMKSSH